MVVMPILKSLATYKGNGKAVAQIKNGKIVALYYESTALVHREYVLRTVGKNRWCKAAEQELLKIKKEARRYRNIGNIIVISGKDAFVTGAVEDYGYTVDHNQDVGSWEYPPDSS